MNQKFNVTLCDIVRSRSAWATWHPVLQGKQKGLQGEPVQVLALQGQEPVFDPYSPQKIPAMEACSFNSNTGDTERPKWEQALGQTNLRSEILSEKRKQTNKQRIP